MAITQSDALRQSQAIRDATDLATQATNDASTALDLAGGMITGGTDAPTDPGVADRALYLQQTPDGAHIWQWSEPDAEWQDQGLDPQVIASAIIGALAAGVIDTSEVTIRSAETGQRVVLDASGLRGYDSSDNVKTSVGTDGTLDAVDATVSGVFTTRAGSSELRIEPDLDNFGVALRDSDSLKAVFRLFMETAEPSVELSSYGLPLLISGPSSGGLFFWSDGTAELTSAGTVLSATGDRTYGVIRVRTNGIYIGHSSSGRPIYVNGQPLMTSAGSSTIHTDRLPTVPVAKGGTGATTAADARAALGITDDSGWSTITSGWASGYSGTLIWRKCGDNLIEVRFSISGTLGAITNSVAGSIIPSGIRPGGSISPQGSARISGGNGAGSCQVSSTGALTVYNTTGSSGTGASGSIVYTLG